MSSETRRLPFASPVEWKEKRDARRQLLEKVRARRRLAMRDGLKNNAKTK